MLSFFKCINIWRLQSHSPRDMFVKVAWWVVELKVFISKKQNFNTKEIKLALSTSFTLNLGPFLVFHLQSKCTYLVFVDLYRKRGIYVLNIWKWEYFRWKCNRIEYIIIFDFVVETLILRKTISLWSWLKKFWTRI